MRDRFGGVASGIQYDRNRLVRACPSVRVPEALGVRENPVERAFGLEKITATPERVGAPDATEQLGVRVPDRRRERTALRVRFLRGVEFVELAVHARAPQ